ncbi:Mitochondrial acidic protein mam33 [Exophiala xenobiotica]|uniref:Mitochondrial acidic protein mam33 n=1 Tax=Lithohypha guttulata TaxID=1690604 RepID=A0ABR0KB47_9EURO|nr:Mitochondrial acidic protein mam33 [Lithohypha guttulata]KAK5319228.1 Mitochondrial acidic protein mam33 [Exophiala xenobiotica]
MSSKPDHTALPRELEDFLADSPWTVQDPPGTENIVMTRKLGDESIKVDCTIADMNNDEREADEQDEDSALGHIPFASSSTGIFEALDGRHGSCNSTKDVVHLVNI